MNNRGPQKQKIFQDKSETTWWHPNINLEQYINKNNNVILHYILILFSYTIFLSYFHKFCSC